MKFRNYYSFLLVLVVFFIGCKSKTRSFEEPIISLDEYKIVDGFDLKVVASEPLIEAPVVMDFDDQGRMWVVEMKGYMQNLEGTGEDAPNGVISIMQDLDNDGVTDHSKVFLDSLVLPRAMAHVYGGLLYAEPPNLWFVDIENDKPKNKVLVDSLYSEGGNVEHQPNGLMVNIDNWIYNAKSNFRYQRKNGKWLKEPTSFRGQWGISKDNLGRLYYNNNSTQLIGDYVLPNSVMNNPYYKPRATVNKVLTRNQKVYPLHPTSVNRGYAKGTLDKDSLLINVTAACGPLIYRGGQFEEVYKENAFVCVPEANLIKRNILSFQGDNISAKHAYEDKEFLASTDEGFRPVNLFNGPDGSMYIVDMHRGIIQDKAYLSPYLLNHLAKKKLDTIVGMGRILKVSSSGKGANKVIDLSKLSVKELANYLEDSNGWVRDRAQQILIHRNDKSVVPTLEELIKNSKKPFTQIHALYTLKGLDVLTFETLLMVGETSDSNSVLAHCLLLMEEFASESYLISMVNFVTDQLSKKSIELDFYLSTSLGKWAQISSDDFFPLLYNLSERNSENSVVQEGVINSIRGRQSAFNDYIESRKEPNAMTLIADLLQTSMENEQNGSKNSIFIKTSVGTDPRTAGFKTFKTVCAACHGIDGNGIEGVAPPLNGSEYVKGDRDRLALIILHGLSGPVHVNGTLYELNGVMPGLANNPSFSDADIYNIISYMNNAFTEGAKGISPTRIKELRDEKPKSGEQFTEKELLELIP